MRRPLAAPFAPAPVAARAPSTPRRKSPAQAPARARPAPPHPSRSDEVVLAPDPAASLPLLAIVIDDLGNDASAVERIAALSQPVAGAVLPALRDSSAAARQLAAAGKEVLLHLPMEPTDFRERPGPGLVRAAMSPAQIEATVESDLADVPGAIGVNNHMGSAGTADRRTMAPVMRVLARRGLFFLDSRTSERTVAAACAREAGVRYLSRRVFLDDEQDEGAVSRALDQAVEQARAEGSAIAIGHPHRSTLAVLEREIPRLSARGVRLARLADLMPAPAP
jgi:uncharacterized protein